MNPVLQAGQRRFCPRRTLPVLFCCCFVPSAWKLRVMVLAGAFWAVLSCFGPKERDQRRAVENKKKKKERAGRAGAKRGEKNTTWLFISRDSAARNLETLLFLSLLFIIKILLMFSRRTAEPAVMLLLRWYSGGKKKLGPETGRKRDVTMCCSPLPR